MKNVLILLINLLICNIALGQNANSYQLIYASYLGGSDFEQSRDLAVDKEGNVYITGGTSSSDFPVSSGVYQQIYDNRGSGTVGNWGPMSVFVSKFSADGDLIWSTFIGGPSYDRAYAIEVDDTGKVYIGGRAGEGYPTTPGAYQEDFTVAGARNGLYGHQNGFVSILSADGSELLYSTYYGSDSYGFFRDIDIDDKGYVYGILNAVTGTPGGISADAYDNTHNGGQYDMVPVKFTPELDSVVWATFLGGSDADNGGPSVKVGTDYSVFIAGGTKSTDFPISTGAVQSSYGGGASDMFVTRIAPDGKSIIYSTYLGGNNGDFSETHCLFVDQYNQAFVAGGSNSTNISTTPGSIKANKPSNDFDAVLFKVSSDGTQLMAASYFGGTENDFSEGLYVNDMGELFFGGTTLSSDFPVSSDAYMSSVVDQENGFVVQLDSNFSNIVYSSYYGAGDDDAVRAFSIGPNESIYLGGQTLSNDLPSTAGAFQLLRHTENNRADCYLAILAKEELTSNDEPKNLNEHFLVYPNPSTDILYIQLDEKRDLSSSEVQIHNVDGNLIKVIHPKENLLHISTNGIPNGAYSIQFLDKKLGYISSRRFVINRKDP